MAYFTKWPEAYPISDLKASTIAEVLVQHWISRFGVPLQLHSDQGRNFDSAVFKRLVSSNQHNWYKKLLFFCLPTGVPFTRLLAIPHPRCFSDVIFVCLARERIGMASEKMKTRYDTRATEHGFHEGNKVWLWNPKRPKGLSEAADQLGRSLHSPKKTE
ncbi:retrovirus-related Pol polyprotein from transposon 412 [Trichonephila clavipes]|uniref:Retrovirus-related Pol polyprotein from transposon 412 n=1 Tax=Trichonephila clavipes TaxID=2585209 RepID=A0A8X6V2I2_TRICX|nr:retrovirus-related Pol polyprotein from transposon 412 [Trichonephila clavipes]